MSTYRLAPSSSRDTAVHVVRDLVEITARIDFYGGYGTNACHAPSLCALFSRLTTPRCYLLTYYGGYGTNACCAPSLCDQMSCDQTRADQMRSDQVAQTHAY